MSEKLKYWLASVFFTFVFEICVLLGAFFVMEFLDGDAIIFPDTYIPLFIVLTGGLISLAAIALLNRAHDRIFGISVNMMKFGRWGMTALLMGLIIIEAVMIWYSYKIAVRNNYIQANQIVRVLFLILLAFVAVSIYVRNYDNLRSRMERIDRLVSEGSIHKLRRFGMLVESSEKNGQLHGQLRGSAKTGDEVNVLFPDTGDLRARIAGLFTAEGEIREAENMEVTMVLEGKDGRTIGPLVQYTVVTDVDPAASMRKIIRAENPRLNAMLYGLAGHHEDDFFMSTFIYDMCHAAFIVPSPSSGPTFAHDIVDVPDTPLHSFLTVSSDASKDMRAVAVFTDWNKLRSYPPAVRREGMQCTLMRFCDIIRHLKEKDTGLIINPGCGNTFYLSRTMIDSIVALEGYQEEFGASYSAVSQD
ncbi:MAG: SseB family protein [Solobacterium sp.]|nr:SseB family protein [Solobacterium sp.]